MREQGYVQCTASVIAQSRHNKPAPKSLRSKSSHKRMIRQRADLARQPYVQQILRSLAHPSTPSTHNTSQRLVALPCPPGGLPARSPDSARCLPSTQTYTVYGQSITRSYRSRPLTSFGLMSSIADSRRGRLLLYDRLGQSVGASKTEGWINPGRFTIPYHG